MSLDPGLLAAILAAPDDDGPRLAMSDWCEEQGEDARAEFIRVQCRIAEIEAACGCGGCVRKRGGGQHTNGPCGVDQERDELPDGRSKQAHLRRREREMLKFWREWVGPAVLRIIPDGALFYDHALLCRGFVHALICTAADWLTHAAAILAQQPIREVVLTTWPDSAEMPERWRPFVAARVAQAVSIGHAFSLQPCGIAEAIQAEWPGITFKLPPVASIRLPDTLHPDGRLTILNHGGGPVEIAGTGTILQAGEVAEIVGGVPIVRSPLPPVR